MKSNATKPQEIVSCRMTLHERRLVEAAAARHETLLAHYVRDAVLTKAREEVVQVLRDASVGPNG